MRFKRHFCDFLFVRYLIVTYLFQIYLFKNLTRYNFHDFKAFWGEGGLTTDLV